MIARHLVPLIFFALAACEMPPPLPPGESSPDRCNAGAYGSLIGQSRDIFAAMTFPAPMRIISPGDVITMDYNPERLNFTLDSNGIIRRVHCG